jgi:hypothetical protein
MEKTFKAHPAVSLFLILRIVFTTMPISAAELTPAIGNIVSIGSVIVDGSQMDSGKLLDGDHIRTGDLSYAKVVLLNGNSIQLSSGTDLVVTRNNEDIRLQLSSGTVSFTATDNHLAMAFGQYEISPESGASGSVTIKDGGFAAVRLETGSATLQNADERRDIRLSGVSERTLTLKSISSSESPIQLASNLPSQEPNAPAQNPTIPNVQEGPQILSVNPSSLKQGSERTKVTITGRSTNFFSLNSVEVSGPGVTVLKVDVIDSTHLRATVVLTSEATPGPRTLTVTTGDGTATSTININATAPGAGGGSSGGSQGGSHTGLIIAGCTDSAPEWVRFPWDAGVGCKRFVHLYASGEFQWYRQLHISRQRWEVGQQYHDCVYYSDGGQQRSGADRRRDTQLHRKRCRYADRQHDHGQ